MCGLLLVLLLALLVGGCPREPQEPERADASACVELSDCNGGLDCAAEPLRACVDGRCERTASLIVPCIGFDAGP
ncbi:MAG: hypothetical protein AAGF12_01625 [Myxococcota bacterium]